MQLNLLFKSPARARSLSVLLFLIGHVAVDGTRDGLDNDDDEYADSSPAPDMESLMQYAADKNMEFADVMQMAESGMVRFGRVPLLPLVLCTAHDSSSSRNLVLSRIYVERRICRVCFAVPRQFPDDFWAWHQNYMYGLQQQWTLQRMQQPDAIAFAQAAPPGHYVWGKCNCTDASSGN